MAKYSSKEQELFFKPWRIQVVIHELYSSRDFNYQVIIRDVTKQGIPGIKYSWLHKIRIKDTDGATRAKKLDCWDYEVAEEYDELPDSMWFHRWSLGTKANAIEVAKAQAVRLQLPFDLQTDIVEYKEIERGEKRDCVACGQNPRHSFDPFICPDCKLLLETGRKTMTETLPCAIYSENLLEYGFTDQRVDIRQLSQQLARDLAQIARAQIGDYLEPFQSSDAAVKRDGHEGFSPWSRYRLFVGQNQAEAMTAVVRFVNQMMRLAYQHGFSRGKSLLLGLASGDLSIGEFEEREIKRAKARQGVNGE